MRLFGASQRDFEEDRERELRSAVEAHLNAAEAAATGSGRGGLRPMRSAGELDRAQAHLDAAEVELLRIAPDDYVRGALPGLLIRVRAALPPGDPRRSRLEEVFAATERGEISAMEREKIVAAVAAASAEARRDLRRVRSFRNVLLVTAALLTAAVVGLAVTGAVADDALPLCFTPRDAVVCPTDETALPAGGDTDAEIQHFTDLTTQPFDIALVLMLGSVAGALSAAFALYRVPLTSVPYSLPVAVALLKLPVGALAAFLGLVFMRGEFLPGFGELDSSAQILAWAAIFGFAGGVLTRTLDQRAQAIIQDPSGDGGGRRGDDLLSAAEVRHGFAQTLTEVVPRAVRHEIAPPPLVNYSGWITVRLTDDDGADVELAGDGVVSLDAGRTYDLTVFIGKRERDGLAAPLRISGGVDAGKATFVVKLDSDDPRLRQPAKELTVPTSSFSEDDNQIGFQVSVRSDMPRPLLWIRVSQQRQFVQHVELVVAPFSGGYGAASG